MLDSLLDFATLKVGPLKYSGNNKLFKVGPTLNCCVSNFMIAFWLDVREILRMFHRPSKVVSVRERDIPCRSSGAMIELFVSHAPKRESCLKPWT